jgi:hypothetical protein
MNIIYNQVWQELYKFVYLKHFMFACNWFLKIYIFDLNYADIWLREFTIFLLRIPKNIILLL